MDDLLRDFLTESNDNLAQLDRDIVTLERNPADPTLIHGIFRTIHTIKGTCGFIGLTRLEAVAHAGESVLSAVRDGVLPISGPLISEVLNAVDVIKSILEHLDQTEAEPVGDDTDLIARLNAWLEAKPEPRKSGKTKRVSVPRASAPRVSAPRATVPRMAALHIEETPVSAVAEAPTTQASLPRAERGELPMPPSDTDHRASVSDSSVRVHIDLLDNLMTLVGELVLDRNRLMQLTANLDDSVFATPVQHLNRVTTDLQEAVMKTRMQPIGGAWTKLPRLVRDLAHASGKQLTLEMKGEGTELDRQILQAITDPLTHMIRNSGDHGVEMPDVRVANGKPAGGTITLQAYHEGGHVIIEVSDDGAGISVERVRQKAIDRGLVTRELAETMNDGQVLRFIFEPGFSTAAKITSVSGRGVGMDVVRTNIEKIGGQVELQSVEGQGTSVRIKIPLTLAIIPALVVTAGHQRYAIPQANLLELVRLDGSDASKSVESLHGAPVYRLRGRLLPLVDLTRVLGNPAEPRAVTNIVVLQAEKRSFGLVVDGLSDSEEIVVKPLSRHVKHLGCFAGATIMGDGRVALILDIPGLARHAHVVDDAQLRTAANIHERASVGAGQQLQTLLVAQAGAQERVAIELARISRLEEFTRDSIEYSRGRAVAQYRGSVIPLLHVAGILGEPVGEDNRDRIPVIVHTQGDRTFGLIVDRILDIVEQELVIERDHARPGTVGTAVIQGRVTDLLDIDAIIADFAPTPRHSKPIMRAA